MKNLSVLTDREVQKFFDSFDFVFSDVDGVLWNLFGIIKGAQEAITSLKQIGKKVIFVSNNTTKSLQVYQRQLKNAGFQAEQSEIVTPFLCIASYLKEQKLDKEIFVLGTTPLRQLLQDEGFKVAKNGPDRIKETFTELANQTIVDTEEVGAVVVDIDINLNYVNLQKAATFLERPEVLFLSGATDFRLPTGTDRILIGPGYFTEILEQQVGRKAVGMAKPSPYLRHYLKERFTIRDPSRVLFIGDSIPQDMGFATECGFQKFLVLSGLTRRKDLTEWKFPTEYKPDFYATSLEVLHNCMLRNFASKL